MRSTYLAPSATGRPVAHVTASTHRHWLALAAGPPPVAPAGLPVARSRLSESWDLVRPCRLVARRRTPLPHPNSAQAHPAPSGPARRFLPPLGTAPTPAPPTAPRANKHRQVDWKELYWALSPASVTPVPPAPVLHHGAPPSPSSSSSASTSRPGMPRIWRSSAPPSRGTASSSSSGGGGGGGDAAPGAGSGGTGGWAGAPSAPSAHPATSTSDPSSSVPPSASSCSFSSSGLSVKGFSPCREGCGH